MLINLILSKIIILFVIVNLDFIIKFELILY